MRKSKVPSAFEVWEAFEKHFPNKGRVEIHHPRGVIEFAHKFITKKMSRPSRVS